MHRTSAVCTSHFFTEVVRMVTDDYGWLRMVTECGTQPAKTNARHIFDALCGNFTARVRAPQGCERAGLDWSVLSSASARQASKITFASAKGRPSISRECSGKTDQASPQGAADKDRLAVVGRPTEPPAHTAVETVALNPLGKCVRKGWGV